MKTTVEISDALLQAAKDLGARTGTTLRELVEAGLRRVLADAEAERSAFRLEDRSVGGEGMAPDLESRGWDAIRDLAYEGRGA